MERKMFGKVVAALRKEQIDFDSGYSWSQEKLAKETGLTTRIVGKIERGSQVRLDRGTLQELARVFRLTSLERREFFAMASEITDEGNRARRPQSPESLSPSLGNARHALHTRFPYGLFW